jgi:hypothetical protein
MTSPKRLKDFISSLKNTDDYAIPGEAKL